MPVPRGAPHPGSRGPPARPGPTPPASPASASRLREEAGGGGRARRGRSGSFSAIPLQAAPSPVRRPVTQAGGRAGGAAVCVRVGARARLGHGRRLTRLSIHGELGAHTRPPRGDRGLSAADPGADTRPTRGPHPTAPSSPPHPTSPHASRAPAGPGEPQSGERKSPGSPPPRLPPPKPCSTRTQGATFPAPAQPPTHGRGEKQQRGGGGFGALVPAPRPLPRLSRSFLSPGRVRAPHAERTRASRGAGARRGRLPASPEKRAPGGLRWARRWVGSARRGDRQPMSTPASVSLPLGLPGPEPRGHSPSRLRPPPPRTPRADDAAPPQPMAFGNLSPAARPPWFKSASLSLAELQRGGPGGTWAWRETGSGGPPASLRSRAQYYLGRDSPGAGGGACSKRGPPEALPFRGSDRTPITPPARPRVQDRREMSLIFLPFRRPFA